MNAPNAKRAKVEGEGASESPVQDGEAETAVEAFDEVDSEREETHADADMEDLEDLAEGADDASDLAIKLSATKAKKKKDKGNGGFKENPYTYISPDDPILQGCMCVPWISLAIFANSELAEHVSTSLHPSLHLTSLCATRMAKPCAPSISPMGSLRRLCNTTIIPGCASLIAAQKCLRNKTAGVG